MNAIHSSYLIRRTRIANKVIGIQQCNIIVIDQVSQRRVTWIGWLESRRYRKLSLNRSRLWETCLIMHRNFRSVFWLRLVASDLSDLLQHHRDDRRKRSFCLPSTFLDSQLMNDQRINFDERRWTPVNRRPSDYIDNLRVVDVFYSIKVIWLESTKANNDDSHNSGFAESQSDRSSTARSLPQEWIGGFQQSGNTQIGNTDFWSAHDSASAPLRLLIPLARLVPLSIFLARSRFLFSRTLRVDTRYVTPYTCNTWESYACFAVSSRRPDNLSSREFPPGIRSKVLGRGEGQVRHSGWSDGIWWFACH